MTEFFDMDSDVIGDFDVDEVAEIVGQMSEEELAGVIGELVGARRGLQRRARRHGFVPTQNSSNRKANALRSALSAAQARQSVSSAVPQTMGRQIVSTNQRQQICPFVEQASIAAGSAFTLTATVQKAIQLMNIITQQVIAASGVDASGYVSFTDVKVGTSSQLAASGTIPSSLFANTSFQTNLELTPASTGQQVQLVGSVAAAATGPITIRGAGMGIAALAD